MDTLDQTDMNVQQQQQRQQMYRKEGIEINREGHGKQDSKSRDAYF